METHKIECELKITHTCNILKFHVHVLKAGMARIK